MRPNGRSDVLGASTGSPGTASGAGVQGPGDTSSNSRTDLFHIKVTYGYEVDGRAYTLERTSPYGSDRPSAETRLLDYPRDERVPIFHSPDDPSRSTLTAGETDEPLLILGIGVVCSVVALVLLILVAKPRRRSAA